MLEVGRLVASGSLATVASATGPSPNRPLGAGTLVRHSLGQTAQNTGLGSMGNFNMLLAALEVWELLVAAFDGTLHGVPLNP